MKGTIFLFIAVGMVISLWSWEMVCIGNKQQEKERMFVDSCVKRHGTVSLVGTWYTNNYLVCLDK